MIWDKTFGGNGRDQLFTMEITQDAEILLGGSSSSDPNATSSVNGNKYAPFYGLNDMWLVKIDQDGNLIWENTYGGSGTDLSYAVIENNAGNFLISGVSASFPNTEGGNKTAPIIGNTANDFWVVHIIPDGQEILWDMTFRGNDIDAPAELQLAPNGGYIFAGHSNSLVSDTKSEDPKGANDFFIIKTQCSINLNLNDIQDICSNEVIELDLAIDQCIDCEYYWNDGYQESSRTLPNGILNSTYSITVVNKDGCSNSDQFDVNLFPSPEQLILDNLPISCFGDSNGVISVLGVDNGKAPFRYEINEQEFFEPRDFNNLDTGDYYLSVIDFNECKTDTLIALTQPEEPLVSLPDDLTIAWGDSIQIQALVNPVVSNFTWSNPTILSCDDCLRPYVSPFQTTSINITVKDKNGGEHNNEMIINVEKNIAIYIPIAFSPNGDG
ncbi:MAG: hypothetical protein NXI23_06145 [Bacteroidetes bacterium]|nr:hypothetical protein [Bacteroidota bacterium]